MKTSLDFFILSSGHGLLPFFLTMLPYVSPNTLLPLHRQKDSLVSSKGEDFPIVREIPRFVSSESYTDSFGLQWQIHSKTQLDSQTGHPISKTRLERCLGKSVQELKNQNVLEAGCGAGRFTELMAGAGALVHAIDLSHAVDANKKNIGDKPNYLIAQANILNPPFQPASFDWVICLGVLQHTPSPEESVRSLWKMVKPGGYLVFDHYTWSLSLVTKLSPLYRFFIKNLPPEKSKKVTDFSVKIFFPLHWKVRRFFLLQALLSRVSPCLFYYRSYPFLTKEQHYDLCLLDTFDHLTDKYKRIKSQRQISDLLKSLNAEDVWVQRGGIGIEARCRKPC